MKAFIANYRFNPNKIGIFGFCLFAPISIAISQIFIAITLLSWIGKMIIQRKFIWQKTPFDIPILIYLLTQLIAVLHSPDISNQFLSWLDTDWFIFFYYACVNLIDNEDDYKLIIKILIVSGIISALYGIWQHFYGWDFIRQRMLTSRGLFFRATGFFGLSLTYGGIQLAILSFIFPFIWLIKEKRNRILFGILLLIILISIIASYARSAWFALIVFILILSFILEKKYILYALIIGICVIFALYIIHPDLIFNNGLISMIDFSDSAPYNNQVRFKLWESSINLLKDYWLFGTGHGNFSTMFEMYKVPFDYHGLNNPHNDFLHIACSSGLIGGISFLFLWVYFLVLTFPGFELIKQKLNIWKVVNFAGFAVVFIFLIAGITQEYYRDAETAQLWWFCAAFGTLQFKNRSMNSKN